MVDLIRQPGKITGSVAGELDLTRTAVRELVRPAERHEGRRHDGPASDERSELAQLRKELREDSDRRGILKRGVASGERSTSP